MSLLCVVTGGTMKVNWRLLRRSILAALIAVCANTIACLTILKIWQTIVLSLKLTSSYYNHVDYEGLALTLTFAPLVGVMVIFLPLQAMAQRFGITAWRWYSLLSGISVAVLGYILTTLSHYQRHPILVWAISLALGFLFGSIFWLIRRPDKDERKQQIPTGANP